MSSIQKPASPSNPISSGASARPPEDPGQVTATSAATDTVLVSGSGVGQLPLIRDAVVVPALTGAPEAAASSIAPSKTQHRESALLRLRLQSTAAPETSLVPDPAERLYEATRGAQANGKELFRVLADRSSAEISQLREAFQSRYGMSLDDRLGAKLSGTSLEKARLLLEGDSLAPAVRDARLLAMAVEGVGTDEKELLDVLFARGEGERDAIKAEYEALTGRSLKADLEAELSGATRIFALAMFQRGTLAPADKLRAAMTGLGTHEEAIFQALEGLAPAAREATITQYQQWYGRDLKEDLQQELGKGDLLRANILLQRGEISGADELHMAMAFAGTDEAAIKAVCAGKSDAARDAIIADYNARYGDLDEALQRELSGVMLSEVTTLMNEGALSPAEQLHRAMRGFGVDEEAIFATLEGLSPAQLDATKADYQQRYGQPLETHLRRELRGASEEKALLLAERGQLDLAETLYFAARGIGAETQQIFQALEDASAEERSSLDAVFSEKFGQTASSMLASELSGRDLERATLLHAQGSLTLPQALSLAMDGVGTREGELFEAIAAATPEARRAVMTDAPLMARLASELGEVDLARATLLLAQGSLTKAQTLHFAMAGWGTDEEILLDALKGLKPEESAALLEEYEASYGRPLIDDLRAELGKRDLWKAIDRLAAPPTSLRERVDRVELGVARERHSGSLIGNVSDGLMDLFSATGFALDQELREYKAIAREAPSDAPDALEEPMRAKEKSLKSLRKAYRKEKVELADTVGSIATYSVAYGAMAVTGGMAALPAAALIAGASGTTRVATRHLVIGDSYDLLGKDGAQDMIIGVGEGLSSYATGLAKDAVSSAIGKRVLAAQGKDVSAKGLLQLGRAALRETTGTITEEMVHEAAEKLVSKAGKEFLTRSLLHELAGEALISATKKGVEEGVLGLSETLADEGLYDMEFSDAVRELLTTTTSSALKGLKKGAVSGASIVIGERISDALHDRIHVAIGRRLQGGEPFSDAKLHKAGRKVLGERAEGASDELLKALGRERLLRKLGKDALEDTAADKAMSILLEPLLVRGVSSAIRISAKSLEDHELWADGLPQALETVWGEILSHAEGNVGKVVGEELTLELSRYIGVLAEEGFLETFLATAVHETAANGAD